jgi:hypothetical protein
MKLDTAIDDNRGWMRNLVIGDSRGCQQAFRIVPWLVAAARN